MLEACLGLGVGTFVYATVITEDLVAGLISGMMATAIGGFGMWIGFAIARALQRQPTSVEPTACTACSAPLLQTKQAGTGYCPRCDKYYPPMETP